MDAERSAIWGTVELVRPAQFAEAPTNSGYSDRRYRAAKRVDYSQPGYVVVYLDRGAVPDHDLSLSITESRSGDRLEPKYGVVGLGRAIRVQNRSSQSHVVSCPEAGLIQRLAPGQAVSIPASRTGEHSVWLLNVAETGTKAFVVPGPFAVVEASGRWKLPLVAPGDLTLRTWHPRFPAVERRVDARRGESLRLDLEISAASIPGGGSAP